MLKVFNLPDLGEGLTESELLSWKIAVGDTVAVNDVLAEVETAKAVVELSSPFDGTIAELHGEPGAVIQVGAPIISFDLPGAESEDTPVHDDGSSSLPDGRVPTLVGYGAAVEGAGRPARRARAGRPSAPDPVPAAPPSGSPSSVPVPAGATATLTAERPRSTPPVRKLARDLGVDIALLDGSGAGGLVTREDVTAAADDARPTSGSLSGTGTLTEASPETAAEAAAEGVRTLGGRPRTEEEPIRSVRKATAAAMTASAFTAPHVTEFLTVDVTEAVELLQEVRQRRDFRELKLTPLTLVARAACLALERTPELNSRWDGEGGRIIRQNYVNLGIAAATPRGLMVPNLKDAQGLDLRSLAIRLAELTAVAREGKLTPEQLSGGTFTLTNVGVFGVDAGTPIINPGEAGILAIGQVRRMPWEYQDEVALRQVMTLSLSFDHRLVDGEQGSRFLADVGAVLARPGLALALL
ncbi:2-oxo acid dehydrogenase subunit E2 [Cellulosimicrobium funkei]|nr:2-oxo acid dehydrogenase subunit E2 [Cellulosimicrobium funkei]